MNVYLIKTPEYDIENFEEVQELLSSFDGPLKFIADNYEFNPEQFPFLQKFSDDFRFPANESDIRKINFEEDGGNPLSWLELFSLCEFYRNTFKIRNNDYVVLLTLRKNALNWFSHFDENKNIFVHTGDWEYYTKAPQKFPVAYQVVENVMQHLMSLDSEQIPNPNIHIEPLGCMNDFCQNKQQVILKLRTGDICHDCLSKMQEENVDDEIVNQAIGIFEVIRTQLLFKQGFTRNLNPKPVKIEVTGQIIIGEKKIDLNPLESTLFIFFLKHKEGISLNNLQIHRQELLTIYKKIRPSGEESKIDELIKPYHEGGSFSVNKSRLNKKLKTELGEPLANFYLIDGNRGEAFKISINPDFVTDDIRY
ncbi:MAG: hypothetical protein WCH59_04430 [Chitinophagia bacterium]|jgi:hypothetical protein